MTWEENIEKKDKKWNCKQLGFEFGDNNNKIFMR